MKSILVNNKTDLENNINIYFVAQSAPLLNNNNFSKISLYALNLAKSSKVQLVYVCLVTSYIGDYI